MADNLTLNSGSGGATLATDDITDADGAHYQRVKLTDGTANSTTHIHAGGGAEANALRVTIANDSTGLVSVDDGGGTLSVDGTVTANLSATDNAVLDQIEVNTSYGDSTGGGTEAAALRVTLANDSTGLISVDDNGSTLSIDNTNIDNLHSEDFDTGAGTDTTPAIGIALPASGGAVVGGTSANPLRTDPTGTTTQPVSGTVTANAGTGTFTVDGSGVTQPVSGTITANLSATDNAVLDQIDANTDFGAVVGGGVEATALRVTLANDSTGTLTVDDGGTSISIDDGGNVITVDGSVSITGAVDLGANNDVTVTGGNAHDGTTLGNPVLGGARATNSIEGVTQVANADLTYLQADLNGVLITRPHTTLEEIITERVSDTAGTSTNFTNFAAGGAGIHNYVTTISIYNSSATDGYVDFRDGSAGSIIFTAPAPAAGGSVINLPVPLKGAANTALAYDVSGALSTVYISVVGFQAQG